MTRDETAALLRARSALTSQPYGPEVIDAWHEALGAHPYGAVRSALTRAARELKRISVADIVQHLPARTAAPEPPGVRCELCDGQGWIMVEESDPLSPTATAFAKPCRCTAGRAVQPAHKSMIEHSDRLRTQLGGEPTRPPPLQA